MSDVDMSEEDANSLPTPNSQEQQYLLDIIAQLEHKLQKAHTSINLHQIEKGELINKIIELKGALIKILDILES
jgi:uncharacterized protein YaaR (DUF327 family)